jgi:hypothetical protein
MADDLSQLSLELCNRAKLQNLLNFKARNMTSMAHLILASLIGVFMTVLAMYISTFMGTWLQKPLLDPPGFNLMLAPRTRQPGK